MFLDYLKKIVVKKQLNKALCDVKDESLCSNVVKVALIVDGTTFEQCAALKSEFTARGILESNIKMVVFGKDNRSDGQLFLSYKNLDFRGKFKGDSISEFLAEEYDLLVNYYEQNKPVLMLLTQRTSAKFKVGLSGVDSRLNHFIVKIDSSDYKGFVNELFRYLKILNKI